VFGLNIANFLCILYTSALTVSVAGTIKTIIVFCTSWLFFRYVAGRRVVVMGSHAGVTVALIACMARPRPSATG
jgi:hypothetical protein